MSRSQNLPPKKPKVARQRSETVIGQGDSFGIGAGWPPAIPPSSAWTMWWSW